MAVAANLIPPTLKGQDFLAASHYKISYDDRLIPDSLKSTFHKDYIPLSSKEKPEAALPPKPSHFMHKDSEKINMKVTETCQAFPAKQSFNDDKRDKYSSLYKTNFKMDSDERISSFNTTHAHYYKPNPTVYPPGGNLARNWMKSQFPQGDAAAAEEPQSNYRGSFTGHDMSKHRPLRVVPNQGRRSQSSSLVGDNTRRFETTHGITFNGLWNEPCKPVPKHTWSSIPEGDKDKVSGGSTTMHDSFQPNYLDYNSQDSYKAYQKLYATNYNMQDGHGTFDKYLSTQADSYMPAQLPKDRFKRDRDRNASDIPQGDLDPYRGFQRMNSTVARSHHRKLDLREAKVERPDGPNLRTVSNVKLGQKELASRFYDTTCDSTYQAVSVPYDRAPSHPKSNVPLYYFGDLKNASTTRSDFPAHDKSRLRIHPVALDNLRAGHFAPPLAGQTFFSTNQDAQYTPKSVERIVIDPGRLQRSTVPIGTMGKFIKGCHNGW